MERSKKSILLKGILILALALMAYMGFSLRSAQISNRDLPDARPSGQNSAIFDTAHILDDIKSSTAKHLALIQEDYAIEAMIVTLPSLPPSHTIDSLAAEIFSNWQIGATTGGRGLLLLLSNKEKLIKIEVSYELEDVFTDVFCGYIEDKQLKAYFLSDQVDIGIVAVMEEIEQRSRIKHQEDYTAAQVEQLDTELLSGGAGAKRQLSDYREEEVAAVGLNYPPGQTPDEAWQTLIRSWENKVRDPDLGVYTEITRLAYRDFVNLPDSRYEEDVATYKNKPYEVIGNHTYAVIFFGKMKGWDNAPFLFCRTAAGWQFDIVHQRKYVRMGRNPHWGIERADHPYVDLLANCPYWMNQDIPREGDDVYRIQDDHSLAGEIKRLEKAYASHPEDFATVLQLGKLYTITSLSPKKRMSLLKKAQEIDPDSPEPYKYLGIVHLDAFYQFESAIKEMEVYVSRRPEDVFGHNYLGYLYYSEKKYKPAIKELNTAIGLRADNCYAYCKLSRAYAGLFLDSSKLDPRRSGYRQKAVMMFEKASATESADPRRIKWLRRYLFKKKILE
ncbi:MAG: TPM domain-containing protein [Desulfobacteraceae bacterium]|nr:TPM domain-containing protein [Desulfobacteraceae bacterium]